MNGDIIKEIKLSNSKFSDPHRKIHYCRGKYFAVGSNDRRIHIRSLETGHFNIALTFSRSILHIFSCLLFLPPFV